MKYLPFTIFPKRLLSLALATAAAALFVPQSSQAALIVDWGGNYVATSSNQEFDNEFDSGTNGVPSGYGGFAGGEPLSLTPTSGYTGPAIHGSILELETPNPGTSLGQFSGIIDNGNSDFLNVKGDDNQAIAALVLFTKPGFLADGDTQVVSFDNTSSVRLNITTYAGAHGTDSGRLVLRQGASYYISEQLYTAVGNHTTSNLLDLQYFAYDPTSSPNVNSGSLTTPATIAIGGVINNITSIGFYFEASTSNRFQATDFEVNATVIPEPSSALLLLGGAGVLLGARRRRLLIG